MGLLGVCDLRAVVQRVLEASVTVEGRVVASIGRGLLVLLGIEQADQAPDRTWMAEKIPNLRIFEHAAGKMNLSVVDVSKVGSAGILVVPNFTVAGDAKKGRRPSFVNAMRPEQSEAEFGRVVEGIKAAAGEGVVVQTGVFRTEMKVMLVNDGPITIWLDSR